MSLAGHRTSHLTGLYFEASTPNTCLITVCEIKGHLAKFMQFFHSSSPYTGTHEPYNLTSGFIAQLVELCTRHRRDHGV